MVKVEYICPVCGKRYFMLTKSVASTEVIPRYCGECLESDDDCED